MSRSRQSSIRRTSLRFRHAIESLEARQMMSADALVGLDLFRADLRFAGIDGRGYSVVVIDHGADLNHEYFGPDADSNGVADRIVYQQDFGDDDGDASDGHTNGHGTSVTGVIGSQDAVNRGVAPGCNLIVLKIFPDQSPEGDLADLEAALQWVEANRLDFNIVAVNLSIADRNTNFSTPHTELTSDEFARLAGLGVIVVAAAGNEYFANSSVAGVSYPAADPNVIAVSAVWADNYGAQTLNSATNDRTAADHVAAYSQRHPTMTDIFAPGGYLTTASNGGGFISRRGTSFAAPMVTGAAVLMQQLAQRELGRRLTPQEFIDRINSTGALINDGDDEIDNVANTGADFRRLNILALGESLLADPGLPTLAISDLTVTEEDVGEATVQITVQISRSPTLPVTVNFATADGSATFADNDYLASSGQLTFLPGDPLTKTIDVTIIGDTRHEPNENLRVNLSNPANAVVLDPQAIVTILDNDQPLPWQNPVNRLDVNNNGFVTGLDALIIINKLNTTGPEVLPDDPPPPPYFFYDVSGDNRVTALDALMVINHLNSVGPGPASVVAASESGMSPGSSTSALAAAGEAARSAPADIAWHAYWMEYEAQMAPRSTWETRRRR